MKKEFLVRKEEPKEKKIGEKTKRSSRNNINSTCSNNSSYINISRSYIKCNFRRRWNNK